MAKKKKRKKQAKPTHAFPVLTPSAKKGKVGVDIVSRIVHRELGWLFRTTHQEHDFGIDGYIDVVTDDGLVTGKSLAVQIKTGEKYFRSTSGDEIAYYGEKKHLNYLANHPAPVLLIVCDEKSERCYWQEFELGITDATPRGWKVSIPLRQEFDDSCRPDLERIVGEVVDFSEEMEAYWEVNEIIDSATTIHFAVAREDIEAGNFEVTLDFFARLGRTPAAARQNQGKVDISVSGYESDSRELYEVPEVVEWLASADLVVPWFFFLGPDAPSKGLQLVATCCCGAQRSADLSSAGGPQVEIEGPQLARFFAMNFMRLNAIAEWAGLTEEDIKRITFSIYDCLNFRVPGGPSVAEAVRQRLRDGDQGES